MNATQVCNLLENKNSNGTPGTQDPKKSASTLGSLNFKQIQAMGETGRRRVITACQQIIPQFPPDTEMGLRARQICAAALVINGTPAEMAKAEKYLEQISHFPLAHAHPLHRAIAHHLNKAAAAHQARECPKLHKP